MRRRWRKRARSIFCSISAPTRSTIEPGAFVVYIGTHGDRGAHRADVILPGAAYTEKTGTYVNTEGRPQFADRAVFPPGDAREDWSILRALSDALGAKLPYDSLTQLRAALAAAYPHLVRFDQVAPADPAALTAVAGARRRDRPGAVPVARRGLLSHQPDRARLARHGRMLGPGAGPGASSRGIGADEQRIANPTRLLVAPDSRSWSGPRSWRPSSSRGSCGF